MSPLIRQGLAVCAGIFSAVQLCTLSPELPLVPSFSYGLIGTTTPKTPPVALRPTLVEGVFARAEQPHEYSSIVFTGDTMLARHVEYLMNTLGPDYPFAGLNLKTFAPGAAIVTNFEASIPRTHVPTPALQVRFSVPDTFASTLAKQGITHASLANNHSFDHGALDYTHTIETIESADITSFGHPNEVSDASITYIETDTETVALIGISTITQQPTEASLRLTLEAATAKSDTQIIYIHWGGEYATTHNTHQEAVAKTLVDAGADLIIGHHPHVVQDIQLIEGTPILYSLGNYVFDQYFSVDVQTGLIAQYFSGSEAGVTLHGVSSLTQITQPRLMEQAAQDVFLQALAARSDPALKDAILSGFIPLEVVATSSKMAMID